MEFSRKLIDSQKWSGIAEDAQSLLRLRDYQGRIPGARELMSAPETITIPGVEILPRTIHLQRGRGVFGELARLNEGRLQEIGFCPQQWSAARMYAGSAKGFHLHPPCIPDGKKPEDWFHHSFLAEPDNFRHRQYEKEQWDLMFFLQGSVEVILVDLRAGLTPCSMRFFVDGDFSQGTDHAGVVIPPGVAHALRVEGSMDVVTVYGTSTSFRPEFEGRLFDGIESWGLPEEWEPLVRKGSASE